MALGYARGMGAPRPGAGAVDACVAALGRHQLAREHGVVVLSVLADDDARQGWTQYLAGGRRREVAAVAGSVDDALCAWLAAVDDEAIADAARDAAAHAAAVPAGSLTAHFAFRGTKQREEWIADWALTPALRLAAWLCQEAADGERQTAAHAPMPRAEIAGAVAGWLGGEAPALAIAAKDDVAAAARCAAAVAYAMPFLPVALRASRAALGHYLAAADESTSKAMVRQGLVGRLDQPEVTAATRALGRNPILSTLAAPPTPESAGEAALFTGGRGLTAPGDAARSAAERILRLALDGDERTRGRFAANVRVDVDFGGRPAEIDLLDAELRIAVEVDGHYHFRDGEAYRRDRRKDVLLQRHGYLVMRFLADDVVARADEIVAAIADIIALRRGDPG
jgi:very-short-patch-repair endonuclease